MRGFFVSYIDYKNYIILVHSSGHIDVVEDSFGSMRLLLLLSILSFSIFSQSTHLKVMCSDQVYHVPRVFLSGLNLQRAKCIESNDEMIILHSPSLIRKQIEKVRLLSYRVNNQNPLLTWSIAGEISNVSFPGVFSDDCGEYLLGARLIGSQRNANSQIALFFETPKVVTIKLTAEGKLSRKGRLAYYGGDPQAKKACDPYLTSYRSPKDRIIDFKGISSLYFLNYNLSINRQEMTKIKY